MAPHHLSKFVVIKKRNQLYAKQSVQLNKYIGIMNFQLYNIFILHLFYYIANYFSSVFYNFPIKLELSSCIIRKSVQY